MLLSNALFKSEDELDKFQILLLGVLYSRGSVASKVKEIMKIYDVMGEGVLYTTQIRTFLEDVIEIACVLMPLVAEGRELETGEKAKLK